jgi:hypothetical protein
MPSGQPTCDVYRTAALQNVTSTCDAVKHENTQLYLEILFLNEFSNMLLMLWPCLKLGHVESLVDTRSDIIVWDLFLSFLRLTLSLSELTCCLCNMQSAFLCFLL